MQKTYRRTYAPAVAGQLSGLGVPRTRSLKNTAGSTYNVWEFSIPAAPTANSTYSITVDGITINVPTDATPTQAELETATLQGLRLSEIYDIAVPTLNIASHKIQLVSRQKSDAMVVTATAALNANNIIPASISTAVPFGRIVGRSATDPSGTAHLFRSLTDKPLGATLLTRDNERIGIGQAARGSEYHPDDMMDILDRCNSNDGIWLECVETSDISESDPVYISVAAGNEGKVTKLNDGTTAVLPKSSFRGDIAQDPFGKSIILVSINFD